MDSVRLYFPNAVRKSKFKRDLTMQSRKCINECLMNWGKY